jgi:HSP20 family protein
MRYIVKQNRKLQLLQHRSRTEKLMMLQRSQIDQLFEKLIHRPWGYACWQPFVDVIESDRAYTIMLDLPGVDPDSVHVHVGGGKVTIEGHRMLVETPPGVRLCCSERPRGMFLRSIDIPRPVQPDIQKRSENGVLTVTLLKQFTPAGGSS